MKPNKFNQTLKNIKEKVELLSNSKFNCVLLNLYRDGQDSNGWHSDNEKELVWKKALEIYPGYARYKERLARPIAIFELSCS